MRDTSPAPQLAAQLIRASYGGAILVLGIGCLVMFGWMFDLKPLESVLTGLATMKFNTALCFALAGVALLTLRSGRTNVAILCAAIITLIGGLTLVEYIFGWNLGLDQLFVQDLGTVSALHPGRMSPVTALNFTLVGISLLLVIRRRWLTLAQLMALIALFMGLVSLAGYLYGVRSLYEVSIFASIALHTAASFVILCLAILFFYPQEGLVAVIVTQQAGGLLARRLLPAAVIVPLSLGWLRLQGQIAGLYGTEFGLALFALSNVLVFSNLVWWTARALNRVDSERVQAMNALRRANDELEARVMERTDELHQITRILEHEIVERIKREDEIRRLNAELEGRVQERTTHLTATIKELDAFNYSVSHDLRTPLRALDGFGLALLQDYADRLDDKGKHFIERIRAGTQRMGHLIDDLLRLSRLSRVEMVRESVDLSQMAQDILNELQDAEPERQVQRIIQDGLIVNGDQQLIQVALQNLLGNAWKFTAKQARPCIELGMIEHQGSPAYIERDNGAGFDKNYANKLFRAFQRLHDVSQFEGTGIGLATVQRVIERHGGQVWAEGAVDQGATFYLRL